MPSTSVHPNFKRASLTFEIENKSDGYYVKLIEKKVGESFIAVPFATEEAATKAGQAILDYSYGPAGIDLSKVKVKPKEDEKPKTRKAPGKKKATKSESAGTAG